MQAKALAADSEAQAASHAIRELLCSALEEKQDVHSSADFANLRGRPAMLHALLQGCGSPTSPVSHLPLLGHDSLAVLQAAVESLARGRQPRFGTTVNLLHMSPFPVLLLPKQVDRFAACPLLALPGRAGET